jgi:putative membrane protein
MPWMHVKLGFVFALYYHGKCQQIFNQLQNDQIKYTTILCAYGTKVLLSFFCGSLLVILKNAVNWIYGVIGIFIFLQSC